MPVKAHERSGIAPGHLRADRQTGAGKHREVTYRPIHGQDAAREDAGGSGRGAASIGHVYIQFAQLVPSVGHPRGAHTVRDQDGLFGALGLVKQADHCRVDVNAIADEFGKKRVVVENIRGNAGIAMVQAAHGIEGVGGAARACEEAGLGFSQAGVAVAQAAHHAQATGMLDQLERCG